MSRFGRARSSFAGNLSKVRSRIEIDETIWEDIEEALLFADVGVNTTDRLIAKVRQLSREEEVSELEDILSILRKEMTSSLESSSRKLNQESSPSVWLFVGVNGVGKTTTIGKIANQKKSLGQKVVLAAGDTFRAAAVEQLKQWAGLSESIVINGSEGADPSSVVFDAVEHAASKGAGLVLVDTAGRVHTKSNLMEELQKIRRVAEKGAGTVTETLLVLDATTGQNGLMQAKQFTEAAEVTGVVLTKLDGTSRGGIIFAIHEELGIPVKLIGVGEGIEDLFPFDPTEFVNALFD
ncbi:MAG TPA: signal recognition particle-docking protein FtsY [Acidimicrobiales bacterium]|jgi:fused signal recognition particle receptor|nr:signal recognition particle-docking protein FtsY [Acidimicrobiales bacterium]